MMRTSRTPEIMGRLSRCFAVLALPPLFAWHLSVLISVPEFADGTATVVLDVPAREGKPVQWDQSAAPISTEWTIRWRQRP
jgi:hypothetical protein